MGSRRTRAIESIDQLHSRHVIMKDADRVDHVISEIIDGGADKLQVIADFDMTLSAFTLNGNRCVTCHKALDDCPKLSDSYRQRAYALRDHYYPIEIDPSKTREDKLPLMVKWWTESHDLMQELQLDQSDICDIVRDSNLKLRKRCDTFFTTLHQNGIPLLIFSAGIGNVIEEAIKIQATMHDNMHIVSNFMDFNEQGKMVGFKGDLIHSFNKNENAIHDSTFFSGVSKRKNCILLGDSLGDLGMAEGAQSENVLKIGFLNDKVEERKAAYLDAFDIVLIDDESMDVAHGIIQKVLEW